jgi:hypothetical protein
MPKISSAKRSFIMPSSPSALMMIVVELIESVAPRKMLSIVPQPNIRPIWYPTNAITVISSVAPTTAVVPTRTSCRRLKCSPRLNIRKITPSSDIASMLGLCSGGMSGNGGV